MVLTCDDIGLQFWSPESSGHVPLRGVSVSAHVVDFCAHTSITQHFVNTELHAVDVKYVFPLDARAAVCGFEADVGGFVGLFLNHKS